MISQDFAEPLFNHLGFISPLVSIDEGLESASAIFEQSGAPLSIIIPELPEYSGIERVLVSKGFKLLDQMSVMKLIKPKFRSNPDLVVRVAEASDINDWCQTYLASFYGSDELLRPVLRAVEKSFSRLGAKFLIAYLHSKPVGVTALYQRGGLTGVYCVGTLPEHRRKGVASTVLKHACSIAAHTGSSLILQTFVSDFVEPFYSNSGFDRVYKKNVLIETGGASKG